MIDYLLIIVLLISVVTDLKSRKILNIITLPTILIGLSYHFLSSGVEGLFFSLKGLLLGFGVLFIPFALGGMGAGDVKLMTAIGAVKGTYFTIHTFLYGAAIGGVISLFIILKQKHFISFFQRFLITIVSLKETKGSIHLLNPADKTKGFPYGIAITAGVLCTYLWGGIL